MLEIDILNPENNIVEEAPQKKEEPPKVEFDPRKLLRKQVIALDGSIMEVTQ